MAGNRFGNQSNAELLTIMQQANTAISGAAMPGYGVPAAQTTALTDAITAMSAAIPAADNARVASKAATQALDTARQSSLEALGAIGSTIYYNPDVTDEMIADAGYAVHDSTATKNFPFQVTNLTATPNDTGTVRFTWDASGNVYPTTYIVEGRASESDPWTLVGTTTKTRVSLSGFTPGATHYFRVKASKNGQVSDPSATVGIWLPGEEVVLSVAA